MDDDRLFDVLIVDDIFPSSFSPFRTLEYNHYLWFFNSAVLSLEGWHLWIENLRFEENLLRIDERFRSRVFRFQTHSHIAAKIAYVTFLTNAARLLPYFESKGLPFILQLYPGGGFAVGNESTDADLRAVLLHPLCRKVIVTQTITRKYIVDQIGCDPEKVVFIFGGVFDSKVDFDFSRDKKIFGKDKETIDFCFVAHKYGSDVSSKGYDYFVRTAQALSPKFKNLRFHVVGDYRRDDVDLEGVDSVFTFHGRKPQDFFADFYPGMDAIISFNRPFMLKPGAFDGFPTGACLEAAFRGVANIVNDPLGLNCEFVDGRDLIILDDDFDKAIGRIEGLIANPSKLAALGEASCRSFRKVMDIDRQLWLRTKLILDELLQLEGQVIVPARPQGRPEGTGVEAQARQVGLLEAEVLAHRGHVADLLRHIRSLEDTLSTNPVSFLRRALRGLKRRLSGG